MTDQQVSLDGLKKALAQFEDMQAQYDLVKSEYLTQQKAIYTPPPPPIIPDDVQKSLDDLDFEYISKLKNFEATLAETQEQVRGWAPNFLSKEQPSIKGINWSIQRGATAAKFDLKNVARVMEQLQKIDYVHN